MSGDRHRALLRESQARHEDHSDTLQALIGEVDALLAERVRLADVLRAFYTAPLSMSSVQPILTLAEELNPSLRTGNKIHSNHFEESGQMSITIASSSAQPCGCDVGAGWVCEAHRS